MFFSRNSDKILVSCQFEKVLFALNPLKNSCFWERFSFGLRLANFKYFLTGEKTGKSWDSELLKNFKKIVIQALAKSLLEKNIQNFAQKWQKFKNTFVALKWSKMIFFAWKWFHSKVQTLLNSFSPRNFFHTTFSFCCRSAWNMLILINFEI